MAPSFAQPAPLSLDAVARLAGTVVHDLNNLLTIIFANVAALKRLGAMEEAGPAVTAIEQAAQEAALAVAALLDGTGGTWMHPEPVDVADVVHSLRDPMDRLAAADVAVEVDTGTGPTMVVADRSQLRRVLLSLAVQAPLVLPCGGRLQIRVVPPSSGGDFVVMTMTLTGPIVNLDRTATLRLPLEGLLHEVGAELDAEQSPGEGRIVVRLTGAAETGERADRRRVSEATREPLLLVEDDARLRTALAYALQTSGFRVIDVATCSEALAVVDRRREVPALVLVEMSTSELSGRELAARLMTRLPHVKVLYFVDRAEDALPPSAGAFAVLPKPFDVAQLIAEVRRLLGARPGAEGT